METLFTSVIIMIADIFELYVVYRFMTIFFDKQRTNNAILFGAYIFRFLFSTIINNIAPYILINLGVSIIGLLIITLCYQSTAHKRLLVSLVIYMCGFIAELIVALLIGLSNIQLTTKADYNNIFIRITTCTIFWVTTLVARKFKNIKYNIPLPKIFILVIALIPISAVILQLLIFQQKDFSHSMTLLSLTCVLASTFITIYVYDTISRIFQERAQLEIIKKEKDYYHDQTELLLNNHEELRRFRHDTKNLIIAMQEMLLKNQSQDALRYTEQLVDKLQHTTSYSSTGNAAIDSIVNYLLTKAANKGIHITHKISLPEGLSINEDDIIIVLGNLIDNAIEANEYVSDGKFIDFDMEFEKNALHIDIKNSYDSYINTIHGEFQTRKTDNSSMHGIGLKSVRHVLARHDGFLDISYDNRVFSVSIMMCA